ncbi:hypothetical protein ACFSL6_00015 [Paenibacillus thailandensis]|uniref:hypothetical protein n=1 Tax=Paenibacillus thailandensis TaxID=393250 RepID=UPI00363D9370
MAHQSRAEHSWGERTTRLYRITTSTATGPLRDRAEDATGRSTAIGKTIATLRPITVNQQRIRLLGNEYLTVFDGRNGRSYIPVSYDPRAEK